MEISQDGTHKKRIRMTKQESILVEQQFFRSRHCRRRGRLVSTVGSLDGCRGRLSCVLQAPQDARTKSIIKASQCESQVARGYEDEDEDAWSERTQR